MSRRTFSLFPAALVSVVLLGVLGCRQDMHDQPKFEAYETTTFFEDGRASRPAIEGTIAYGHLKNDSLLYQGKVGGQFSNTYPFPITAAVLERGRERYDAFCAECHDRVGNGEGMVVSRGFPKSKSLHEQALLDAKAGALFDSITNGKDRMFPFRDRILPEDRWAIVAYIRALQRSQNAKLSDVPTEKRGELQ